MSPVRGPFRAQLTSIHHWLSCNVCSKDEDFYGEKCRWTGLCNQPFVGVKAVLRAVRKLAQVWGLNPQIPVEGSYTRRTENAVELCHVDDSGTHCAAP